MNVLNIHQKDEQYSHPCSSQVRVQKWRLLRVWRRLGLGFGGGQGQGLAMAKLGLSGGYFRVKRQYIMEWFLNCLSFSPFMVFECTQNLQPLLVVASHSFVIVTFEAYNLCNLLVIQLFHFMSLEAFISCFFSSYFQQVMGPHQARERTLCQNKKQ